MSSTSVPRLAIVVVDAKNPKGGLRYRTSYWRDVPNKMRVEEYCVPELVQQHEIRPIDDAGLVILNWDSVNGDPVCESDVTLRFFQAHGKVQISRLMSKGGILLSEFQTAYGIPVQEAYDTVFGERDLTVLDRVLPERALSGKRAFTFRQFSDHPLIPHEPSTEAKSRADAKPFSIDVDERHRGRILLLEVDTDSLWFGWFTSWKRDWLPLLYAPDTHDASPWTTKPPVMLARTVDHGLMIASTMGLAKGGCRDLIENLASADVGMIRAYHESAMRRRTAGDLAMGVLVTSALVGAAYGLWGLHSDGATGGTSALVKLLLSVLSVGLIAGCTLAWHLYRELVWRRPNGTWVLEPVWVWVTREVRLRRAR